MNRLVRRRRTDRDDRGTTLVELLVVMLVLGIIGAMVQGTVMIAHRTTDGVGGRVESSGDAKVAIDAMSKNLRTAVLPQLVANATCDTCATVAFVQGTPTSVQFYANNNNDPARLGPSKVTYTLTDGTLTEKQQKPDPHAANVYSYTYCNPGPGCVISERVLARNVTGNRLFTYYDRAGLELTGSSLNSAQLSRVDSIDVNVQVRSGPNVTCTTTSAQCTTLVQRVTLPNADTVPEVTATATP
jgi:prepilin-type N-terminal cleavage/methylation domain-containing protein